MDPRGPAGAVYIPTFWHHSLLKPSSKGKGLGTSTGEPQEDSRNITGK